CAGANGRGFWPGRQSHDDPCAGAAWLSAGDAGRDARRRLARPGRVRGLRPDGGCASYHDVSASVVTGDPMSPPRKRADVLLVERGLFESRARARAAIEAGLVTANDKPVAKPSETIATDAVIQAEPAHPFVSRGGVKLAGALERYPIEVEDHVCLDVGASTGGFTEVLLANGASLVFAIDVGTSQLHPSLRGHP